MTKRYRPRGSGKQLALAGVPLEVAKPVTERLTPRPKIRRYSPSNQYNDIDFAQVTSALRAAEMGMVEQLADLSRRALSSDDHLVSVYQTRINAVAGAPWKLSPGSGLPGSEEIAKRAAEDCRLMLESLPSLEQSMKDLLDATFTGWSVLEIIWRARGDAWMPSELVWLHPRRFKFEDDYSLRLYDGGQSNIELTPNKYLQHIPRTLPNYPPVSGLIISCLRWWWVKSWVTRYWLSGSEVAGNPRMIGKVPREADAAIIDQMVSELESMSADGVAVVREGSDVVIQSPLAQGSGSVWETLAKRCDAAMSKAVLGSTLNVEVGDTGGNRALGESQGDVTIVPRLQLDQRAMWRTIERDLFRPFLEFNRHRYGGAVPPIPRGESLLIQEQVEVDDLIVNAGVVTVNELRQSRGLEPLATGGDELVRPAQPAPQPFAQSEAPAARPLRQASNPWETAMSIALSSGRGVTGTSGR